MAKAVERRKGTATEHASFTGNDAELTVNTTNKSVHVHDGATAGGFELARVDLSNTDLTATITELNYVDGVTSNIQTQLNSMVEKAGDTMTGDLSLGDNVKAKFGASNDLEIFHDGGNSVIKDGGTGDLYIQGEGLIRLTNNGASEHYAKFNSNGAVQLYYDNAEKLATTSTGVDVTGTITTDGLTVDGATEMTGDRAGGSVGGTTLIKGYYTNGHNHFNIGSMYSTGANLLGYGVESSKSAPYSFISTLSNYSAPRSAIISGEDVEMLTASAQTTAVGSPVTMSKRMKLSNNGDLHLYEDTGTTAKFVWDSSAESLGVGTSPSSALHIRKDAPDVYSGSATSPISVGNTLFLDNLNNTTGTFSQILFRNGSSGQIYNRIASVRDSSGQGSLAFVTGSSSSASERLRIDSLGRVGIGTASPSAKLSVHNDSVGVIANYKSDTVNGQRFSVSSTSDGVKLSSGFDTGIAGEFNIDSAGGNSRITFSKSGSERARIDDGGNLLVAKTAGAIGTVGHALFNNGQSNHTVSNGEVTRLNRKDSDGDIQIFYKDDVKVGSIGTSQGSMYLGTGDTGLLFRQTLNAIYPSDTSNPFGSDGVLNLGSGTQRFKDLYLSGGVYLGGTGAVNKLDDYETGAWTPAIGVNNFSQTPSTMTGTYTKVGRLVTVYLRLNFTSATTMSSYSTVTGLPFSASKQTGGIAATNTVTSFARAAISASTVFFTYLQGSPSQIELTATYEVS